MEFTNEQSTGCTDVRSVPFKFTPQDFLREAIICLGTKLQTPVNVCTGKFGEVRQCMKEALVYSAEVTTNYSAAIGYDRTEEYWDKEERKDSNGNRYYVDVKKTRIVTDWCPHSGVSINKNFYYNLNTPDRVETTRYYLGLRDALDYCEENGEPDYKPMQINMSRNTMERDLEQVPYISWPGDRHKNENYNYKVGHISVECHRLPFYEVDFEYEDTTYTLYSYACENLLIGYVSSFPQRKKDERIPTARERTDADMAKPKKTRKIVGLTMIATFFIGLVLPYIIMAAAESAAGWVLVILPIGHLAAFIALSVINNKKEKALYAKYDAEYKEFEKGIATRKLEYMKKALEEQGFEPYNEGSDKDYGKL